MGLRYIATYAFTNRESLKTIVLPDTIVNINSYAFRYCTALESITIKATIPPTLSSTAFRTTNEIFIIYVPAASLIAY